MNTWPIGLSTGCFYKRNILDVLQEVCDSGFRDIEICSFPLHLDYHREEEVRRAGDRIRELGLNPFSFHAPFANHIDITSLDERVREAAVQELLVACRAAGAMGAKNVVLHPGPEREGRPPEHEFRAHVEHAALSLNRVARCCTGLGVQLLLENMLPHLLFGHTGDMMYLLGEIRDCNVGVCLDTGHANLAGELGTVVHKLSGHLKMLHVNDNRRDTDAHLPPGEGVIDWRWIIGELKRCNFSGSLILELAGHDGEPIKEVLARAVRARNFLAELAAEAA